MYCAAIYIRYHSEDIRTVSGWEIEIIQIVASKSIRVAVEIWSAYQGGMRAEVIRGRLDSSLRLIDIKTLCLE